MGQVHRPGSVVLGKDLGPERTVLVIISGRALQNICRLRRVSFRTSHDTLAGHLTVMQTLSGGGVGTWTTLTDVVQQSRPSCPLPVLLTLPHLPFPPLPLLLSPPCSTLLLPFPSSLSLPLLPSPSSPYPSSLICLEPTFLGIGAILGRPWALELPPP